MADDIVVASNGSSALAKKGSFSIKSLNLASKCPAIVVGDTGVKVSPYPFQKIKFEEGRKSRLSLLSDEVIAIKLHYAQETGYVICTGGNCCNYYDKTPAVKYLYPVVQYMDCSDAGKPLSPRIEVKLLVLNREMYDQICLLADIHGSVTGHDLIVTCTSTQYQKLQLLDAGNAMWMTTDSLVSYVSDYMEKNGPKILDSVGKILTDAQLKEKFGDSNIPAQEALSAEALDDVFKI